MPCSRIQIIDLTHEEAYEEAARLEDQTREDKTASTVFRGNHPEYGNVIIVIPPLGESLLMKPLAVLNAQ